MNTISLTTNDLDILRWINSFGFTEFNHIIKKFPQEKSSLSIKLKQLVEAEYLFFEKIFHAKPGVYRTSKKGTKVSNHHLKAVNKINLATYHHNLQLVDLSFILEEKFQGNFISEREIRHQKGLKGVGQKGHISDGLLQTKEQNIAIELELSSKGMRRRKAIINYYLKHFEYDEMWYLCLNKKIIREIQPHISRMPFIKLIDLEQFLFKNHTQQI